VLYLLPIMVNPDVIYYHVVKYVWFHITCLQRDNIPGAHSSMEPKSKRSLTIACHTYEHLQNRCLLVMNSM